MKRLELIGAFTPIVLLAFAYFKLGFLPVAMLMILISWAVQDAIRGKVIAASLLPSILLPVYYLQETMGLFLPMFAVLLSIWWLVRFVRKVWGDPRGILVMGFGDVVAVPFAVTISYIFIPFWGLPIFGAATACMAPFIARQKHIRLIPWMLPGVLLAFILAVFLF
jgi:hypothetical protein